MKKGYHKGQELTMSATMETFRSQLLEAWQRRSNLLEETIPLLYVEGLSTRDFKRSLKPLWGKSGLSPLQCFTGG